MMRRTPMKPGKGFARPSFKPAPRAPAQRGRMATMGPAETHAAPKDEPAKPGKRAPTVAEREWMDAIVAFGCIACRLDHQQPRPTAVHHVLRGGQRMGHLHTIPLCDPGHHQGGEPLGLISRHPYKARFEDRYGTEEELLRILRAELGTP